ncbi:hypothetical protein Smic_02650 [Streptomyces microflavus]|uniref:Uncharacterized protein n=1 Tax=Streptomyces microflavus TaxID=1919 RepID=A0A7J0CH03_STRMI|nr:hypothetical protein Smic_02650 [Streptomyces microflavus]
MEIGETPGAFIDGDEDQYAAELVLAVEVDGHVLAAGERSCAVVAVEMDKGRLTQRTERVSECLHNSLASIGEFVQRAEIKIEVSVHRDGPAEFRSPALELLAHFPVEIDAERAGGAALLGEGDGRCRLRQRDLGQPYRLRGCRGGRRGRRHRGGRSDRGGRRRRGGPGGVDGRGGGGSGSRLRLVDGDAEVRRQALQPGAVPLPDRTELPGALAQIQLAEDERGLDRGVGGVEAGQLGAAGRVDDPYVQTAHPAESAAVRRGRDDDAVDRRLDLPEVDGEGVGDTVARRPLALVTDGPGGMGRLVVEDEVGVAADLSRHQEERGAVDIGGAGGGPPPQFDAHGARRHRNVGSFLHDHARPHHESGCPQAFPHNLIPGPGAVPRTRAETSRRSAGNTP